MANAVLTVEQLGFFEALPSVWLMWNAQGHAVQMCNGVQIALTRL